MDQSTISDNTFVKLYISKTCGACKPYIYNLIEVCKKFKVEHKIYIIEHDPLKSYKALIEARQHGAVIDYAPFIVIRNQDKYKAVGGILNTKQITKLLKKYG